MQDINLLQNKLKDKTNQWEQHTRILTIILSLVLTVVAVGAGAFYMLSKSATESTASLDQENVTIQNDLNKMQQKMKGAISFQAQTENISTLLGSHVIWSDLLQELIGSTFKTSRNLSLSMDTTGKIFIEGITPTYSELGKVLLSLDTSSQFDSVKLMSSSPSGSQEAGVNFSIEVMAKQEALIQNQ